MKLPLPIPSGSIKLLRTCTVTLCLAAAVHPDFSFSQSSPRERISIDDGWRFTHDDPAGNTVSLLYDVRPVNQGRGGRRGGRGGAGPAATAPADATNAPVTPPTPAVIKNWILPTANSLIKEPSARHPLPTDAVMPEVSYSEPNFDDTTWRLLNLPHDWGVEGSFSTFGGGGTGRLPSFGVGWYRKQFDLSAADAGKEIFLDVDGAMAYASVWLNGKLLGGWPYGYSSWRLNLTPALNSTGRNVLAIRLDNPTNSSRWYPGGGIYRNVWLVKTEPVHIGHWGTFVTTPAVSARSATLNLKVTVDNDSRSDRALTVKTQIYALNENGAKTGRPAAEFAPVKLSVPGRGSASSESQATLANPKLWGPPPSQKPNRYVAVTTLTETGLTDRVLDVYETPFGVRTLKFDPNNGFFINGEHVKLNGVCDHHDLGALGSAINERALERQLQMLVDMGCNAIRTSHNPPAPELLELADKMGLLIMDEAFDMWVSQKNIWDYHLAFPDWHEADLRALIHRDRNHPSVILWSVGNEVGEQGQGANGAAIAKQLCDIVHDEDTTRPTASAMNSARAGSPFAATIDTAGLNYQGSRNPSQYPVFHTNYPDKFIFGSETESTVSSRGVYTFPVPTGTGAVASARIGEDAPNHQVSSYDLSYPSWASSPDREFMVQDQNPFVGGEFVWTGWDYLGEPTPFDTRSSYFGIIDLAGFKKDRFYIYQAHWRPDFKMAHILPHWTWPEREILKDAAGDPVPTPVHVYTSGDEAELFLNGKSLGRKQKGRFEYRIRWDNVIYQPGILKVVAYKNGKNWATDEVKTAGAATRLKIDPDRSSIIADGHDLSFVTVSVQDSAGVMAPRAANRVHFEIEGPGEIVATDNGDAANMEPFHSHDRAAFNGLCLVIVRGKSGQPGTLRITATSDGLKTASATIKTRK